MDLGIRGRLAVVTCRDSGMGYATAEMLLKEGVKVVLTDLPGAPLDKAGATLKQFGEVVAVASGLTKAKHVDALQQAAQESFGLPDILVNAAGIIRTDWPVPRADGRKLAGGGAIRPPGGGPRVPGLHPGHGGGRVGQGGAVQLRGRATTLYRGIAVLRFEGGCPEPLERPVKAYSRKGVLVNAVSPAVIATPMTYEMMNQRSKKDGTTFNEALRSFLKEERPTLELQRRGTADEFARQLRSSAPTMPVSSMAPIYASTGAPSQPCEWA